MCIIFISETTDFEQDRHISVNKLIGYKLNNWQLTALINI